MDIKVKKRNGRLENFEVDKINASAQRACRRNRMMYPQVKLY